MLYNIELADDMNDELRKMRKEVFVAYYRALSQYLHGGVEKTSRNIRISSCHVDN
jgi:hypothetical protein